MSTSGFRTKQPAESRANVCTNPADDLVSFAPCRKCESYVQAGLACETCARDERAEADVTHFLDQLLADASNNGAFQGAGYEAALAASLPPRDIEIAGDEYEALEDLRRAGAL